MKRSVFILFVFVIALSLVLVPTAAADSQGQPPGKATVVSKTGIAKVQGKDVLVDVLVVVLPGQNANEAALAALQQQGARPFASAALGSEGFATTGLFWENLPVVQNYNPSNEPGGGLTALRNTHATWSGDDTSPWNFSIDEGNLISRYPSLVRESPGRQYFDGLNDVAWMRLQRGILGVTWYGATNLYGPEADMALNTLYAWSVDNTLSTYDIETVFLHENGHVVGLDHSDIAEAVMYTPYQGVRRSLATDDEEGTTYLYDSATTGIVSGTVTTDGTNPTVDAQVVLEGTSLSDYTDADGKYTIYDVPDPVTYTVTATASGFDSSTILRLLVSGNTNVDFTLSGSGGGSEPPPVVSSCDPDNASPNERLTVRVLGGNFQDGAVVDFGAKVSIMGVTYISSSQLDVKIKVNPKASSGLRDVMVTNPDGQSDTLVAGFTVN